MKKLLTILLCVILLPSMIYAQGRVEPPSPGNVDVPGGRTNPKPKPKPNNKINGYEYVDLGLPSKLKWATCNIGAERPSECGYLYTWGCTTPDLDSNVGKNAPSDISGNKNFDAARVEWGSTWRMPTLAEWRELMSCRWTWTKLNGIEGYKVTGPKGTSIFLPAFEEGHGVYWSSTVDKETGGINIMLFESGEWYEPELTIPNYFCTIRPVSD